MPQWLLKYVYLVYLLNCIFIKTSWSLSLTFRVVLTKVANFKQNSRFALENYL